MALEKKVVALVGGVGGAKLALGLARVLPPECLTIIVNTGDDFWHYGLRVCTDLDTVLYTLAGVVDPGNGWGVAEDTVRTMDTLAQQYAEEPWFRLGDKDLATHLLRTKMLRDGYTFTQVTATLKERLGVAPTILPMTDDEVATIVHTEEHGDLAFQTYFVRHRWQPRVRSLRFEGSENASMSQEASGALVEAELLLIAPSNPWLSIAPILAVPGMRETIIAREIPRVAITPIVGGKAIKGPAAKLMAELGYPVSSQAVADYYGDLINGFIYDERDETIEPQGFRHAVLDTIMKTDDDKIAFARCIFEWIEGWIE